MPARDMIFDDGAETSRIGELGNWVLALSKVVVDFNLWYVLVMRFWKPWKRTRGDLRYWCWQTPIRS
jgi:hypothetical protein